MSMRPALSSGIAVDANPLSSADLAAFVSAFEAGSVHGAASALDLTPSAVTKRLQSLERRVGTSLFERGRNGLRATGAAGVLYPNAKDVLRGLAVAERSLYKHLEDDLHGLLLAASHTIGEFLLPDWLARFRRERPESHVQIQIVNSPGVIAAVRSRTAEIGFVEGLDPLNGLETVTVQRDQIVAVVASCHRWGRRQGVDARELRSDRYLARENGSGTRAIATAALARVGIELRPAFEVASHQSLKRALADGGFTLMSHLAVADEVAAGTLHALPVRDLQLKRELRAVRDASNPPARDTDTAAFWHWLSNLSGDAGPVA
ncbi:LysR family transcriptional regulator [Conexibacter sp. CPCC 206217]|uniref:LysR family transcriptional regulator n=1 Tax=Conexibacter sp. CPCC 206217 TaxID=3064574 RepID=UPI002721C97B|nr:LysR family transcriptional regulator [Conexibacter sp. CPCC 206217]MDO8210208.1 LysR family transcriptional regulator [Conexibacter sp. CPCC 206217]